MGINPYDEMLDELGQTTQGTTGTPATPPSPKPAPNIYDQILDDRTAAVETRMRRNVVDATKTTPDRAAEVRRLSDRMGLPEESISRNFDAMRARAQVEDTPYAQMMRETPALADTIATDPATTAIIHDDLENLGLLEWIVKAPGRAFAQSLAQMRLAELRTKQLYGPLTSDEEIDLGTQKYHSTLGGGLGVGDSWFRASVTGTSQLLANVLAGAWNAGKFGAIGGAAGGIIGGALGAAATGGPGVIPGAAFGAEAGAIPGLLIGGAKFGFDLEAGSAYDEYLDVTDEHGQRIDPLAAKVAATAAGAINAGLEALQLERLAESIPGLDKLKGALTRQAIKQALRNPSIRSALAEVGKEYGKTLTFETATEVAQRAVTILAGELGKASSGMSTKLTTAEGAAEILDDLLREGVGALQGFAFIAAPGPLMSLVHETAKARRALVNETFFKALGEGAAQSKTLERLPEAALRVLETATKDGPVQTLYQDVDEWADYWKGKGIDPREMATEVTGSSTAYDEALRTGEPLAIPTARYAVKLAGTEHNAFFAREIRLGPDEDNQREAEARAEELANTPDLEEVLKDPKAASVFQRTLAQLRAAGYAPGTAEYNASLNEAIFSTFAEVLGDRGADDLFAQYDLETHRPDLPGGPADAEAKFVEKKIAEGDAPNEPVAGSLTLETPPANAGGREAALPRAVEPGDAETAAVAPTDAQRVGEAIRGATDDVEPVTIAGDGTQAKAGAGSRGRVRLPGAGSQRREAASSGPNVAAGRAGSTRESRPVQIPDAYRDDVAKLLAGARALGFTGTDDQLARLFLRQLEAAMKIAADVDAYVEAEASSGRDLLSAIAKAGGLGIEAEAQGGEYSKRTGRLLGRGGMVDELENMLEGLNKSSKQRAVVKRGKRAGSTVNVPRQFMRSGGLPGIPNIIVRKGGRDFDTMREAINESGSAWAGKFENLTDFVTAVDDAIRVELGTSRAKAQRSTDVDGILSNLLHVDPAVKWWDTASEEFGQPAYHGSPHEFERFSLHAIGTGEGAQSYGWGLYFASQRAVAEHYRNSASPARVTVDGIELPAPRTKYSGRAVSDIRHLLIGKFTDAQIDALSMLTDRSVDETIESMKYNGELRRRDGYGNGKVWDDRAAILEDLKDRIAIEPTGKLYTADIPDDDVMLDWDKRASQQPAQVQAALRAIGVEWKAAATPSREALTRIIKQVLERPERPDWQAVNTTVTDTLREGLEVARTGSDDAVDQWWTRNYPMLARGDKSQDPTGRELYAAVAGKAPDMPGVEWQERASRTLAAHGVAGIRYLDGMSRGAGEGSRNYVVFDDRTIAITSFDQPDDYRGEHSAPGPGDAPAHDLTGAGRIYPADVYTHGRQYYGTGDDALDAKAFAITAALRGKPGAAVTIYRAVPTGAVSRDERIAQIEHEKKYILKHGAVPKSARTTLGASAYYDQIHAELEQLKAGEDTAAATAPITINAGDWVTVTREYAKAHGESALDGQYKIVSKRVTAREIFTNGDSIHEWGYWPGGDAQVAEAPSTVPLGRLTVEALQEWSDRMIASTPGLRVLDLRLEKNGDIRLETMAVDGKAAGAGIGTKAMEALTKLADENQRRLVLNLAERGYDPVEGGAVTTSPARLEKFYRRFGFIRNLGRHADHELTASMYRKPAAAAAARREHRQDDDKNKNRRGSVVFRRVNGKLIKIDINLFEKADLSTFLHESGHVYLEVFGDVADAIRGKAEAERTPEQQRLLTDFDTLLAYLGADSRSGITEEHHERFARSFEAYLMEGRAPSLALQESFARFRSWLVGIYRTVRSLNVNLTDEVRAVFDRMLASERAIEEAKQLGRVEPMFATAADMGVSEAEFALYKQAAADEARRAREILETQLLSEVQRAQEDEWRRRREDVRAQVAREINALPVYQATAAMQFGKMPDGSEMTPGLETPPLKLSRKLIVDRFGEARLKELPKPHIYTRDGGMDPDTVAQMYGYASGDDLLTAVSNVVSPAVAIEAETERRMLAEHGSMMLDGTLHERAQAALANDGRERIIRAELKALNRARRIAKPFKKAGDEALAAERAERKYERRWFEAEAKLREAIARGEQQTEIDALKAEVRSLRAKARGGASTIRSAIPNEDVIRDRAALRIAGTRLEDLAPAKWWSTSRKAAQRAVEAAARQDFDGAITHKQEELLNLALYREAMKAKDDIEKRLRKVREMSTPASRGRLGLAGQSYLDQLDGVLERFDFEKVSQKTLERRANMAEWIAQREDEGMPVDMPDIVVNEARRLPYVKLTYEAFQGVTDGLDQIQHLARLKNKLLKSKANREVDAAVGAMTSSIRKDKPKANRERMRDRSANAERRRTVGSFFASHRKLASLIREFDGFADGGSWWEHIMRPLNNAADREAVMNADATRRLHELIEHSYPGGAKGELYTQRFVESVGQSLTKMRRLMIALNWGNEGNRQRILSSEKWHEAQVAGVLETLTDADWDFVEGVWTMIDSYWPEIEAKQKRVYGIAPEKVAALPFTTSSGRQLRGGYFPIKYDDRLSPTAGAHLDLDAGIAAKQAAYVKATTRRGHTKERIAKVNMPVRLDFGVITEHLQQVIHDLSHHEALIDASRLLQDKRIQTAIYETHGDVVYRQMKDALKDIAFGQVPAITGFEKAMNHLRTGATIAGLAWNLTTSLMQPLGLTQSMVRIGPRWVALGMMRWTRDAVTLTSTVDWINDRSEFMRLRGQTQQREISEIRNTVGVDAGQLAGWIDKIAVAVTNDLVTKRSIADSYFYLIQQGQRLADVPTWIGAYEKHMAGGKDEATAIALADQAVIDAQGSGYTKDLAGVQRGGPLLKVWTNFYSFFNTTYNLTVEQTKQTDFRKPSQIGRLAADYMLLYIIPATLGVLLKNAASGADPEPEELEAALIRENISYLMGTMLGTRELAGAVTGFNGYSGPAGARAFEAAGKFAAQASQGEGDAAFWKALNDTAGILLHYPSTQLRRSIEGAMAIADEQTSNPMVLVGGPSRQSRHGR